MTQSQRFSRRQWAVVLGALPLILGGVVTTATAEQQQQNVMEAAAEAWPSVPAQSDANTTNGFLEGVAQLTGAGDTEQAPGYPFKGYWLADVSSAPLDSDQAPAKEIAAQVASAFNGVAAVNAYDYNASIVKASPGTPKVQVRFHDCQNKGATPPEMVNAEGTGVLQNVPIPDDAAPAQGTDGQLTVKQGDDLWELWRASKASDGAWQACWGGRMNVGMTHFPGLTGATASGIPITAGAITPADMAHAAKTGDFGHALYFLVREPRNWDSFSWPAHRSDGTAAYPAPQEGRRFRVDPSINVDSLNLTPFAKAVVRTAQKHGMVLGDRGGAVAIATSRDDAFWQRQFGTVPAWQQLANFPWQSLQQLPKDWGQAEYGDGDATTSPGTPAPTETPAPSGTPTPSGTPSSSGTGSPSMTPSSPTGSAPCTIPSPETMTALGTQTSGIPTQRCDTSSAPASANPTGPSEQPSQSATAGPTADPTSSSTAPSPTASSSPPDPSSTADETGWNAAGEDSVQTSEGDPMDSSPATP